MILFLEKEIQYEQYRSFDGIIVAVVVAFDDAAAAADCWINCLRFDSLTVIPDVWW